MGSKRNGSGNGAAAEVMVLMVVLRALDQISAMMISSLNPGKKEKIDFGDSVCSVLEKVSEGTKYRISKLLPDSVSSKF